MTPAQRVLSVRGNTLRLVIIPALTSKNEISSWKLNTEGIDYSNTMNDNIISSFNIFGTTSHGTESANHRNQTSRRLSQGWGLCALAVFALLLAPASDVWAQDDTQGQDVPEDAFVDDDGSVHEPALNALAAKGYLTNTECADNSICPARNLQRWELAVWLGRALTDNSAPDPTTSTRFADIDPTQWWAPHVERFAELGITTGCSTNPPNYCPYNSVTRAQMATFLTRAHKLPQAPPAGFTDIANSTHADNINALAAAKITAGCETSPPSYCPSKPVTRAQMATFIARATGLVDKPSGSGVDAILTLLNDLVETEEQPSGYDRDLFEPAQCPHRVGTGHKHCSWSDADGDGCDTRKEVLLEEAVVDPAVGSRCTLSGGQWKSRYDGVSESGNGGKFDVDHLVPLAEAWSSGARSWSSNRRELYANDLEYEHSLIAVSYQSNRSKADKDPAQWLPPDESQHCWYAAIWVQVKIRWQLSVDPAEKAALEAVFAGCDGSEFEIDVPIAPPPEDEDCHPAYDPCLPFEPGDALNCGDLTSDQKPVTIMDPEVDPYNLDVDKDSKGCTS